MLLSKFNRSSIARPDSTGRKTSLPLRKHLLGLGILACSGMVQAYPATTAFLDDSNAGKTGCTNGADSASHCTSFVFTSPASERWGDYGDDGYDLPPDSGGNGNLVVINNINQTDADQRGVHLVFDGTSNATLDGTPITSPHFISEVQTRQVFSFEFNSTPYSYEIIKRSSTEISIGPVTNADPVITEGDSLDWTLPEDASVRQVTFNASDPENNSLTWSISAQASKGTAEIIGNFRGNTQNINYTPNANENGADSFIVTVDDGNGGSDTIMVNVTISPVNDAPVIAAIDDQVTLESQPFSLPLSISDVDQDDLTVGLKNNQPDWLSIVGSNKVAGQVSTLVTGLTQPLMVTKDNQGNILVAEIDVDDPGSEGIFNINIQKITPSGTKTKLARLTSVGFINTSSVVTDNSGNLYILDQKTTDNDDGPDDTQIGLRRVTPAGEVSRINITGNGSQGQGRFLLGLTIDDAGQLYSYDGRNREFIRLDTDGNASQVIAYDFNDPDLLVENFLGVRVNASGDQFYLMAKKEKGGDSENLIGTIHTVSQSSNSKRQFEFVGSSFGADIDAEGAAYFSNGNRILKSPVDGGVETIAGSDAEGSEDAVGDAASFNITYGLFAEDDGDILVVDFGNSSIRKINGDGAPYTLSGTPATVQLGEHNVCVTAQDSETTVEQCFTLTVDGDLDGDNIGDSVDNDIDGDGIDNTYETANGLNPRDGNDAAQDKDGDGVSNLDEFTADTNAQADDYAPIITLEDEVTLDATALKTRIPANLATANDALDGAVEVNANLASTLLAPGKHTVIWSASDAAGNKAEKEQIINIRPLANWQVNQQAAEGNNLMVSLFLNGEAPEYPVVANYTVTGSATNPDDHNAQSGSLTIASGDEAQLELMIAADSNSEGDENIIFTLDSISNAVIGKQATHEVVISEQNHAPAVSLNATSDSSNTLARTLFASNSGGVTITASVNDVDEDDSHSLEWEADNALGGTANGSSYQFDPATAGAGVYQVTVTATDDADSPASGSAIMTLTIVDALPALGSEDSDGDGISDQEEGFVDSDGDNVPDFADNVEANNLLAIYPLGGEPVEAAWFVESQAGLNLKLNVYGSNSGDYSPLVEGEDLVDNNAADKSDNGFIYDNGIFDFVVSNMPVQGESVNVIIPQVNAIPAGAVYRKELNGRWAEFVEDANNKVSSAAGERGVCPPPGSDDYQQGLTAGHYCVQLTIEDGGANDADGKADGNIVDPGGVAIQFTTVHSRKGGAFGLLLVSLFGAAYYLRRRIVTPFTQR